MDALSRIQFQTFSHPGSYIKRGMQTNFFLAFYGFRSKVLVIVKKKIRDPRSGSGKNLSRIRIPDPGAKKLPDSGSCIRIRDTA
jgi:hypothetical protein